VGVGARPRARRDPSADDVRGRIIGLPGRFRAERAEGLSTEWELRVDSQVFTISVGEGACVVRDGESPSPALRMVADPDTWMAMDDGRLLPIDAFTARRLTVSGNADLAVRVQTLFRPFHAPSPSGDLEQVDLDVDGVRLSCYLAGSGTPMVLLHGLGGYKLSWLPVLAPLAAQHRLVVPDLPGHGASEKPSADYSPRYFARVVRRLMDILDMDRAVLVGNSMGGRVAIELALRSPARVVSLVLLAPAVPGIRLRFLMNFTRIVPTELGAIPIPLRERWAEGLVKRMFGRPALMPPETFRVAADEFIRIYREPRARTAFFSSLRHLVTERPNPFWETMRRVKQPALVISGSEDHLVAPRLAAKLAHHLPRGRLVPFSGVGHVPQVEAPEEVLAELWPFLDEAASGAP
jgi:pimeloyl-ACP methyl ester carboxylesterase/putative sterol carrier protein